MILPISGVHQQYVCLAPFPGADLGAGVTRVTMVTPLARQPISCYYYACDLSYFDSPVSPDPVNARSIASLARVPKVTPSKNLRSANAFLILPLLGCM